MTHYAYEARNGRGELSTGTLAAASVSDAGRALRGEGKFIIKLREVDELAPESSTEELSLEQAAKQVKRADVIYFAHQMAVMIETGVPITDALDSLAEQASSAAFRCVLRDVTSFVKAGSPFSKALGRHPKVFPDIMLSLIEASEASGTMGKMLERISQYMSKEQKIIRQARGAMSYPLFMIGVCFAVTLFLLTWVMPRFTTIYTTRKAVLPAPTRVLIGTSDFLANWWMLWVPAAIAAAVGLVYYARTPRGRMALDWLKLNIPVARNLFLSLYIARSARTLGSMIQAGVPLLEAVSITRRVTRNVYFEQLWDAVDASLKQGSQLSDPLFESDLLPRSICQMIRSGEKSGRLGDVFNKLADFTEAEFDESVKTTTQFIEPVMVCTMGLLIGFIAISLLLPIFSVGRVVSG